jgi:hypothetical protein
MSAFFSTASQAVANRMVVEVDSPRFGKYLRHGASSTFPTRWGAWLIRW